MADLYNPSNLPHGSRVLTISTVTYVADNYNVDEPTKQLSREDETGADTDPLVVASARRTGTATLQLETTATAYPAAGGTFVSSYRGSNRTYVITQVGQPESTGALKTVSIAFADVGAAA